MNAETARARAIVDGLQICGYLCIRIQSGKVRVKGGWMQLAPAGTPDWLVVHPGLHRTTFLEIKEPGENCTEIQDAMHSRLFGMGCSVFVVRSLQDASVALRDAKLSSAVNP